MAGLFLARPAPGRGPVRLCRSLASRIAARLAHIPIACPDMCQLTASIEGVSLGAGRTARCLVPVLPGLSWKVVSVARRKCNFIKGRLRWKLVGSLCAGAAFPPPISAVLFS